jgi:hypothetical protein
LPHLDVPRDVPLSPRLIQAAYRAKKNETPDDSLDDLTPVDFSAQPEASEEKASAPKANEATVKMPEVMMAVDEGGAIEVPDFKGKTMREVTMNCMRLGLDPVLVGTRLAIQQMPAAGAKVRRGTKVTVEFGDAPVRSGKSK